MGAVHALSPGHGKTIVGAYLIGSRGTPRHALFLGLTVTITHTLGVFALGFATLYASRYVVPERLFPILSLISAALVLVMGIVLLIQRGRIARQALAEANFAPSSTFQFVGSERCCAGRSAWPHLRSRLVIRRRHDALARRGSDAFTLAARRVRRENHLAEPSDPGNFRRLGSVPFSDGAPPRRGGSQ